MPEQEILKEIENAIQNPQLYSASDAKNKLRAAFDPRWSPEKRPCVVT